MEDDRVVIMSTKGYSQLIPTEDGRNLYWTDNINTELPIKVRNSGPGSEQPLTICQLLRNTSTRLADKYSMYQERDKKIIKYTWREYQAEVMAFAKSMHAIGVTERKAVNVMGHNAPEWVIAFIGGISGNCVSSGVYSTNLPDACLY
jgi:long-chain-fatty-acid--CoA ligase ACSBG